MKGIAIYNVSKDFFSLRGKITAVDAVSFEIEPGEFFVLLGPSGCGKSTLLNIIAGIEKPTNGKVFIKDIIAVSTQEKVYKTPRERNVAMVFQSYALYPHMNVFDNIAFPLRTARVKKKEITTRIHSISELLEIDHLLNAKPSELSGGQKQRVAMGRALVRKPDILLLDEPLSNLDAQLRVTMRIVLKDLQRELGVTTLYVTHDQTEAMILGDKIAVMKSGQIQQIGIPHEIYSNPETVFVGRFIGTPPMNVIPGEIMDNTHVKFEFMTKINADEVSIGLRPEHIHITRKEKGILRGRIVFISSLGIETLIYLKIKQYELIARLSESVSYREGEEVGIDFNEDDILIFDKNSEHRIY